MSYRPAPWPWFAGQRSWRCTRSSGMPSAPGSSTSSYLVAGMALLDESDWDSHYDLTFSLWLERAECEYLTGELASAEARLSLLSTRARNIVDSAAVTCVRLNLYTTLDHSDSAV